MNIPTMPQPAISVPATPSPHRPAPAAPSAAGGHPFATLLQHAHQEPKSIPSQMRGAARNLSARSAMNHSN